MLTLESSRQLRSRGLSRRWHRQKIKKFWQGDVETPRQVPWLASVLRFTSRPLSRWGLTFPTTFIGLRSGNGPVLFRRRLEATADPTRSTFFSPRRQRTGTSSARESQCPSLVRDQGDQQNDKPHFEEGPDELAVDGTVSREHAG